MIGRVGVERQREGIKVAGFGDSREQDGGIGGGRVVVQGLVDGEQDSQVFSNWVIVVIGNSQ